MDGLGSASPPVAPTATTGEGRHPCTWPRTFWFKPLSAFGLLDLTTFISSSPELAMPSTLAPNRLSASSRRALSREARPPWVGEVTLSQELRTARLPRPHVLVGYQWSHTGLRPGRKTSHNRYIRSFVSHPPQIRACTSRAPGSSSHEFATRAIRRRYVDMVQVTMYLPDVPPRLPLKRQPVSRKPGRLESVRPRCCSWRSGASHVAANRSANRSEGHHVQPSPLRSPPPRPQPARLPGPLTRAWSGLPPPRRQEVLLVLSQIIAKSLSAAVRKEASHEHP